MTLFVVAQPPALRSDMDGFVFVTELPFITLVHFVFAPLPDFCMIYTFAFQFT